MQKFWNSNQAIWTDVRQMGQDHYSSINLDLHLCIMLYSLPCASMESLCSHIEDINMQILLSACIFYQGLFKVRMIFFLFCWRGDSACFVVQAQLMFHRHHLLPFVGCRDMKANRHKIKTCWWVPRVIWLPSAQSCITYVHILSAESKYILIILFRWVSEAWL